MLEDGGQRHGTGPLGDGFLLLCEGEDARGDLLLGNRNDSIDDTLHVGEGQVADAAHGDAVGKGRGVPAGIDESRRQRACAVG